MKSAMRVDHKKREGQETGHGTGVGMASVLMIVIVLALTSFGILALVSARADSAMSNRTEEFTTAYYAAEGRMAEQLARIDAGLADGTVQFSQDGRIELVEEVREGQELRAVLRQTGTETETAGTAAAGAADPETEQGLSGQGLRDEIIKYGFVNTGEWNPEEEIKVWDGGK